jgi:hypothetical protein
MANGSKFDLPVLEITVNGRKRELKIQRMPASGFQQALVTPQVTRVECVEVGCIEVATH